MTQQSLEDTALEDNDSLREEIAYRQATVLYCNSFHDAHHLLDMQRDILISTHCLAYRVGDNPQLRTTPRPLAKALGESAEEWFAHMQRGIAMRHREVTGLRDPLPESIDPALPYRTLAATVAAAVYEDLYMIDQAGNFDPMDFFVRDLGQTHTPQDFALMQALATKLRESQRDILREVRECLAVQTPLKTDDSTLGQNDSEEPVVHLNRLFNLVCQPLQTPSGELAKNEFYHTSANYISSNVAALFNSALNGNDGVPCDLVGGILAQSAFMAPVMEQEDVAQFSAPPAITPMAVQMRGLQGAVRSLGFLLQADALENELLGFYQSVKGAPVNRRPKGYTATTAFLSAVLYQGAGVLAKEADQCDKGYRYTALDKPGSLRSHQLASTNYYLN